MNKPITVWKVRLEDYAVWRLNDIRPALSDEQIRRARAGQLMVVLEELSTAAGTAKYFVCEHAAKHYAEYKLANLPEEEAADHE